MRAGPSQEEIRRQNLGALLRYVHVHGATSRAELTTALGLNRSTIGALAADLTAAGLVTEGAPRETGRAGRPSPVLRPDPGVYAFALTVEVDRLRAARVGLGGVVLDRRESDRPPGQTAEETAPVLTAFVKEMGDAAPRGSAYAGGGVAVCGMVRREDGVVRLAPNTGWMDEPLGEVLSAELGRDRPVAVGNVADVSALAEHIRGVAVGCDNLIYLYGDVGVGAGIIAGGRPVTGHGGYGGEVGHMVVNPSGRPCSCGSRGCWETEIGEAALLRAAGWGDPAGLAVAAARRTALQRRRLSGHEAVLAVVEPAARGDANAKAAVRQVGDWLGFGVANLVNIFNPEMVIFGGTLRDVYLASAAQVRSRLNSMALPACREHVRLRTPTLGDDAALIGAAELVFEHLLADPLDAGPARS